MLTFFLRDQLQATPDDLGLGLPGLFLQLVQSGPIVRAKTGVNVGLHPRM